jgi:hypothetical protein
MCNCIKHPTVNGEPGYRWNDEREGVHPINPPDLEEGDELLYDEPGRCGGIDSHSHHFRVVKKSSWYYLIVRHGGGDERIRLAGCNEKAGLLPALELLDSHTRYWLLQSIYSTQREAVTYARNAEKGKWALAAANKQIKTRKSRGYGNVRVWIDSTERATLGYSLV